MRDQLEARISAIESIQEEFEHDIREIKEQLVRLTKLVEDHVENKVVQPRESSPVCLNYPLTFSHIQILIHTFWLQIMFQMRPIALTCVFQCTL